MFQTQLGFLYDVVEARFCSNGQALRLGKPNKDASDLV
jgi:hypothetical protein